jgi:hypothetical protein
MKRSGLLFALALLVGCGGSSSGGGSSSQTIDGNWSGILRYSDGATSFFAFTTSLKQSSTSTGECNCRRQVTVTNFIVTFTPPCVQSPVAVTAELDSGFQFLMDMSAGPPDPVGITVSGDLLNNTVTGRWSSRDISSLCHVGDGQFTMTRM